MHITINNHCYRERSCGLRSKVEPRSPRNMCRFLLNFPLQQDVQDPLRFTQAHRDPAGKALPLVWTARDPRPGPGSSTYALQVRPRLWPDPCRLPPTSRASLQRVHARQGQPATDGREPRRRTGNVNLPKTSREMARRRFWGCRTRSSRRRGCRTDTPRAHHQKAVV